MKPAQSIVLLIALRHSLGAQIVLNPPKDASVITVDVDLVNVLCAVRDKRGAYVKDLKKEDFEIHEDGRPREIAYYAREVDSPLTVALGTYKLERIQPLPDGAVVDTSNRRARLAKYTQGSI